MVVTGAFASSGASITKLNAALSNAKRGKGAMQVESKRGYATNISGYSDGIKESNNMKDVASSSVKYCLTRLSTDTRIKYLKRDCWLIHLLNLKETVNRYILIVLWLWLLLASTDSSKMVLVPPMCHCPIIWQIDEMKMIVFSLCVLDCFV